MTKGIDRLAFEYWAGVGSKGDLEAWAIAEPEKDKPHPEVCELFFLSKYEDIKNATLSLEGFAPVSERGEEWTKELLLVQCRKLLKEDIAPSEFCEMVKLFDGSFLDLRPPEGGYVYCPTWLGGVWDACDWCDDSWTLSNAPHLKEAASKILDWET